MSLDSVILDQPDVCHGCGKGMRRGARQYLLPTASGLGHRRLCVPCMESELEGQMTLW